MSNSALQLVNSRLATPTWKERLAASMNENQIEMLKSNIAHVVASDTDWTGIDSDSIIHAVVEASRYELPLNKEMGCVYIIPYRGKQNKAQMQLGYKGYIQLALRTGQYKTISVVPVHEGQLVNIDPHLGNEYNWSNKKSDKIIGYSAMFLLLDGFAKEVYMTTEEAERHGKKYSETYKSKNDWVRKNSKWSTDFDAMAQKTALKRLINKWGPKSTLVQRAIDKDQMMFGANGEAGYLDNEKEEEVSDLAIEISQYIHECKTVNQLKESREHFIDNVEKLKPHEMALIKENITKKYNQLKNENETSKTTKTIPEKPEPATVA